MKLIYSQEARSRICHLHPDIKKGIKQAIENLSENPSIGKTLQRELAGFWSVRFKKYRIIYKPMSDGKTLQIFTVGERKRVYEDFAASRR